MKNFLNLRARFEYEPKTGETGLQDQLSMKNFLSLRARFDYEPKSGETGQQEIFT